MIYGTKIVNATLAGVGLALVQQLLFAGETALLHRIGAELSVAQVAVLRSVGGLLLVALLARGSIISILYTQQLGLQVVRGLSSAGYLGVFAYSFTWMPLADATAISFFTILYAIVFAALILGERVGARRWAAAVVGMIGASLIIKPGFTTFSWAYLLVLIGTSLNGLALALTRLLERLESPLSVMLYLNLICVTCYAPGFARELSSMHLSFSLLGLLVIGPLGQYLGILALRFSEVSTIAPTAYARLILASGAAWVFFGETIDVWGAAGDALIIISCVLAASVPPAREILIRGEYDNH